MRACCETSWVLWSRHWSGGYGGGFSGGSSRAATTYTSCQDMSAGPCLAPEDVSASLLGPGWQGLAGVWETRVWPLSLRRGSPAQSLGCSAVSCERWSVLEAWLWTASRSTWQQGAVSQDFSVPPCGGSVSDLLHEKLFAMTSFTFERFSGG